jgi:hypothetical protein
VPVICIARGGSNSAARCATRIILARAEIKQTARLLSCDDRGLDQDPTDEPRSVATLSKGRLLIDEVHRHPKHHDVSIVDASAASDHTFAIAAALSDLILLPIHVDANDDASFVQNANLGDIVAKNMRRHCRQIAFLATSASSLPSVIHLEIAGLLMRRGLTTLPVPLCGVKSAEMCSATAVTDDDHQLNVRFADCVLKESLAASDRSVDAAKARII